MLHYQTVLSYNLELTLIASVEAESPAYVAITHIRTLTLRSTFPLPMYPYPYCLYLSSIS